MLLRPQHAGFGKPKIVGNPQQKEYKEKGVIDSGCSKHMTGNKCYLTEYEDYDGGFVSFGDGKGLTFYLLALDYLISEVLFEGRVNTVRYLLVLLGLVYTAGISLEPKLQLLSKFLTLEALFEGRTTEISQSSGPINLVAYETIYKEWEDRMERAATTASNLDAEQDSDAQTRFVTTFKKSNDPPLSRGYTLGSGEDSMKLLELMELCTKLSDLGGEGFHQIVDFLNTSHIKFALTENPTIYTSLIQQFWQTASTSTLKDGEIEITATIDGQLKTITEASLRIHLKLEDADGISSLPNTEIFKQLALISPKKTAWEQFSSNIATAIICLATNGSFNFSKMIFKGMVKNLDNRSKFLMHPRFIQILLNKHQRLLLPHKRTYVAPTLTQKLFSNMRRVSKGYTRVNIPLFSSMLVQSPIQQGEGSTVPVEIPTPPHDSPLLGGHTPGSDEGSMTLNELTILYTQLSTKVARLEQDLKQTKKVYGNAYTKLIMGVKKLEHKVKSRQPKRRARVVIFDTEKDLDDPSKQGRRIAEIDQNTSISLPTELVEDLGSGEKGEKEISTANISVSTASATPKVSTAAENLVYIRRSAEKRKDKEKAIIKEDESVQKKTKKQLEQEILGHEEAIRLQE
ncbi:hypothetical protein Tco_0996539 [Tanacetum coccineum]